MPGTADMSAANTSTTCIPISGIKHIEVVDDQTILFHMIGGEVWENRLPFPCLGLKFEGGISYKTGINSLCSEDIITVVRRETPCGLGTFRLIPKGSEDQTGTTEKE